MVYTSHTKLLLNKNEKKLIFLAGSMDINQPYTWRKNVIKTLNSKACFLDPTRLDHNTMNNIEMENHINWELEALALSDIVFLNFLPTSQSPISLIELGMYVKSTKLLVNCPDQFYQSRYIKALCKKYKVPIYPSLNESLQYLKNML